MVNYHSEFVYPLGAFQGRQKEEWDHFGLGITSKSIWVRDHFGDCADLVYNRCRPHLSTKEVVLQ